MADLKQIRQALKIGRNNLLQDLLDEENTDLSSALIILTEHNNVFGVNHILSKRPNLSKEALSSAMRIAAKLGNAGIVSSLLNLNLPKEILDTALDIALKAMSNDTAHERILELIFTHDVSISALENGIKYCEIRMGYKRFEEMYKRKLSQVQSKNSTRGTSNESPIEKATVVEVKQESPTEKVDEYEDFISELNDRLESLRLLEQTTDTKQDQKLLAEQTTDTSHDQKLLGFITYNKMAQLLKEKELISLVSSQGLVDCLQESARRGNLEAANILIENERAMSVFKKFGAIHKAIVTAAQLVPITFGQFPKNNKHVAYIQELLKFIRNPMNHLSGNILEMVEADELQNVLSILTQISSTKTDDLIPSKDANQTKSFNKAITPAYQNKRNLLDTPRPKSIRLNSFSSSSSENDSPTHSTSQRSEYSSIPSPSQYHSNINDDSPYPSLPLTSDVESGTPQTQHYENSGSKVRLNKASC